MLGGNHVRGVVHIDCEEELRVDRMRLIELTYDRWFRDLLGILTPECRNTTTKLDVGTKMTFAQRRKRCIVGDLFGFDFIGDKALERLKSHVTVAEDERSIDHSPDNYHHASKIVCQRIAAIVDRSMSNKSNDRRRLNCIAISLLKSRSNRRVIVCQAWEKKTFPPTMDDPK